MERIVKGLLFTQEATESREPNILIENYHQGFNSNMCTAIVNMSQGKQLPLEYSINWSSVIDPSLEEIKDIGSVELNSESYHILEYAAEVLSELEPEKVTIPKF